MATLNDILKVNILLLKTEYRIYFSFTVSEAISLWTHSLMIPGTNQYRAHSVKFLAKRNSGLPLTGFETTQRLLV